ncbi:MAG: peptidoglycan editing factor PgeF [Pontibacterium sp.]
MKLIQADWPAPANVHALVTTRQGGVSEAPYESLNLGDHVGDEVTRVQENRLRLKQQLGLSQPAQWLSQVHGTVCVEAQPNKRVLEADACWSDQPGQACVVMTADCLPVFFTDRQGSKVAVAHAGWRGLADGVLEKTLQQFSDPSQVLCWLGPAIGPQAFEVGGEVRSRFCDLLPESAQAFILADAEQDKWLADIYQLATLRLRAAGVANITGGAYCTYRQYELFFSYRREAVTGRMASVIWLS